MTVHAASVGVLSDLLLSWTDAGTMISMYSNATCTDGMCSNPEPFFKKSSDSLSVPLDPRTGSSAAALPGPLLKEIMHTFVESYDRLRCADATGGAQHASWR